MKYKCYSPILKGGTNMGYYSTMSRCDVVKTEMAKEEFMAKWNQAVEATKGTDDEGYLDFYQWDVSDEKDGFRWMEISMEEWYAKHYADDALAEFISSVIADGGFCLLEFQGEDGAWWGYYITKQSVKEIEYVRMVDGKLV
jgi:hypothetical protein